MKVCLRRSMVFHRDFLINSSFTWDLLTCTLYNSSICSFAMNSVRVRVLSWYLYAGVSPFVMGFDCMCFSILPLRTISVPFVFFRNIWIPFCLSCKGVIPFFSKSHFCTRLQLFEYANEHLVSPMCSNEPMHSSGMWTNFLCVLSKTMRVPLEDNTCDTISPVVVFRTCSMWCVSHLNWTRRKPTPSGRWQRTTMKAYLRSADLTRWRFGASWVRVPTDEDKRSIGWIW